MVFPEWVEKQKKRGFDIKKIKGNYYMYERKSRWDKEKKKAVKVTGAYIGKVTPEGIVPAKPRLDTTKPIFSLELGASAYLYSIAGDLLEELKECFDKRTAESIWAVSMIRLIAPCPFRRIEDRYQTSWLSKILPKLNLSKNAMTTLIDQIGGNRAACAAFMRGTMKPAPYLLIDGSRVTSKSEGMDRALPGHSKNNKYLPQLNQIYIVSASGDGERMPVFYRNVAGNMPDVTAFELTVEDAGIASATVLADNGFASMDNFVTMEESELDLKYIVPLRRNSDEVDLSKIEYKDVFTYHGRAIFAHMEERDGYRIYVFRDEKMRSKEIADFVGRGEKANAAAEKKRNYDPEKDLRDIPQQTQEVINKFGVIIFRTTVLNQTAQYIYETYKMRWEIELLFKTLRDSCDQDASYMRDDAGFEAWSFLGLISVMVACRILSDLRRLRLSKEWSLEGVLDHLSRVQSVQVANQWCVAETTKKTRELISSLGFSLDSFIT